MLRDPVERAHSNWTHLWSAGLEPIGDFVEACAREPERIRAGWAPFWHYVGLGKYGEQLRDLPDRFTEEQVLVFRYRDLLDRPQETLDRICGHLGVRTGLISEVPRENVTVHPHETVLPQVLSRVVRMRRPPQGPGPTLLHWPGAPARGQGRRPLTWGRRQELILYFYGDIELLEEVTGEDFSDWVRPRDRSGGQVGHRPDGQGQARNGRPR